MSSAPQRCTVRLLLALPLLCCAAPVLARHDGDYLNKVTTKLETPHLSWAKPFARGPLKVLCIAPRTVAPREIVELWQRADIEFEAFTLPHSGLLSFESDAGAAPYDLAVQGTSIDEKTDDLLAKLERKYDAFVFANASLDVLPKECQYKILKQVGEGAGLLCVYGRMTRQPIFSKPLSEGRADIFNGVPLAGLDFLQSADTLKGLGVQKSADLPAKLVETYQFKQGRIAVINWGTGSGSYYGGHSLTPPENYSLNWPANYEGYLQLVYRALLWTTPAHQPQVVFEGLPPDGMHVDRRNLPMPIRFKVQVLPGVTMRQDKIEWTIRDKTNVQELYKYIPLGGGTSSGFLTSDFLQLPRLKTGGHFLDISLKSDKGVEQFATISFVVDAPLTLTDFGAEREFYEKGDTAKVSAKLSGLAPADAQLWVSATDTDDRLYFHKEVPIPAGSREAAVELKLDAACTIATRLHGELRVKEDGVWQPLDTKDQFLFVPRRSSDEFRSVLWGGVGCGNTGLGWLAYQQMRKAGFNAILSHPSADGSQERSFALCDFPLVCYSYRVMGSADEKGWRKDQWVHDVADACFYNPELQEKAKAACVGRTKPAIPYGPSLYSLGDENYYDYDSGFSPIGLQSFREYLKRDYGTLDALNKSWDMHFTEWSQVELLKREDALKLGLWPMIHDHMSFNETEYADYHHFLAKALKEADPFGKVGAEGSEPGDLEKTIEGLDIWGPYMDKLGNELLRSLASKDVVRGNWWGGYVGSHGGRAGGLTLWKQLLAGVVNTSLYYAAIGAEGMLSADLSYAGFFEQTLPELQEVYGGIGQLVSASDVPHDGIAIHWSQATEHSATLFSALGSPTSSQGNLLGLLDSCGFGYRYLTTRTIEAGRLVNGGYHVLFLPASQAISDAEAQAIKEYVRAGGTVVADVATGIMDGHCKPLWHSPGVGGLWHGQLDELLGITRAGEPHAKTATGALAVPFGSHDLKLADFPFRMDAAGLAATGQTQANVAGTPVLITRQVGKGRAIFLNFSFPNPEHPQALGFARELLAAIGLQPACELSDPKGYTFRRFKNGDLTLIGVIRAAETAGASELKLAEAGWVYDVRAGKALGKTASVPLPKDGPRVRLFSVLPAAAAAVTVETDKERAPGWTTRVRVGLEANETKPGGRLLRVEFHRPDGSEASCYRSFVTLRALQGEVTVPLALNDPQGKWTITATDVATGAKGSASLVLR